MVERKEKKPCSRIRTIESFIKYGTPILNPKICPCSQKKAPSPSPSPITQPPHSKPITRSPPLIATGAVGELELCAALPPNAVCCDELLVLADVDVLLVDVISTVDVSAVDVSTAGRVSVGSVTAVGRVS